MRTWWSTWKHWKHLHQFLLLKTEWDISYCQAIIEFQCWSLRLLSGSIGMEIFVYVFLVIFIVILQALLVVILVLITYNEWNGYLQLQINNCFVKIVFFILLEIKIYDFWKDKSGQYQLHSFLYLRREMNPALLVLLVVTCIMRMPDVTHAHRQHRKAQFLNHYHHYKRTFGFYWPLVSTCGRYNASIKGGGGGGGGSIDWWTENNTRD